MTAVKKTPVVITVIFYHGCLKKVFQMKKNEKNRSRPRCLTIVLKTEHTICCVYFFKKCLYVVTVKKEAVFFKLIEKTCIFFLTNPINRYKFTLKWFKVV